MHIIDFHHFSYHILLGISTILICMSKMTNRAFVFPVFISFPNFPNIGLDSIYQVYWNVYTKPSYQALNDKISLCLSENRKTNESDNPKITILINMIVRHPKVTKGKFIFYYCYQQMWLPFYHWWRGFIMSEYSKSKYIKLYDVLVHIP